MGRSMLMNAWMELLLFLVLLAGLTPLLGGVWARVLRGETVRGLSVLRPVERGIYRLAGVDPAREMEWKEYTISVLAFSGMGIILVTALQVLQNHLPLNPQKLGPVPWLLALNTAVSFVTNTNWQAYSGETTMSYLTQMLGLTVQNFVSAATGIAVMAALARGLTRRQDERLGNFWTDLVRATLYILLPLAVLMALLLVSQGVVQNLAHYVEVKTVEGASQTLPMGPAASQIAIKQLGTNGGGFFGVNSAHPFENPTPLSNFIEGLSILLLPCSLVYTFGILVNRRRHGLALLGAMAAIFLAVLAVAIWSETRTDPAWAGLPFLEGKEVRFGVLPSVLWGMATTVASNGSVNAMHSSFSPLTGGLAIFNMMLGEVVFGGVGSGVYGMALFVVLTVFIAGLMVGRTPEYLGKKIETRDVLLAVIGVLLPGAVLLIFTAVSLVTPAGLAGVSSPGPHGLSEVLYAFTSAANNNGSAFAGLNAGLPWYMVLTSIAMLAGRFGVIIPVMALAGGLARKKFTPPSTGTFPTEGYLFVILLIGVVLIVGALTFLPALTLGPIIEHFLMVSGRTF
jgi:potassium-transporting ATPase potassium-binding subunit